MGQRILQQDCWRMYLPCPGWSLLQWCFVQSTLQDARICLRLDSLHGQMGLVDVKEDFLLTGIKRDGAGDALYNLAYGKCARPCEGDASNQKSLRLEHCYHENWWKKFDFAG